MVTAHGGSITVEQAADGGAQFRVKLPVGTAAAAEQDAVIISDKGTGHGRILIVDDHSAICEMLIEFFDGTGLQAEAATSGHKALQQLKTNDYDAIICDLRMPEMDGPALYAAIGASRPELQARFIFATGDLLSAGSRQFLEDSGRPCLEKPFQPDQVRRLVVQTLERRPLP
jgi:CheY-like chemotaxis protein